MIAGWLDGQAKLEWCCLRGISLFLLTLRANVCGGGDNPFRTVDVWLRCGDGVPLRVRRVASQRPVADTPLPSSA